MLKKIISALCMSVLFTSTAQANNKNLFTLLLVNHSLSPVVIRISKPVVKWPRLYHYECKFEIASGTSRNVSIPTYPDYSHRVTVEEKSEYTKFSMDSSTVPASIVVSNTKLTSSYKVSPSDLIRHYAAKQKKI